MIDSNLVEILNFYCIYKTRYKYGYKELLVCFSILSYREMSKAIVHYSTYDDQKYEQSINFLVHESMQWAYGSMKSTKFGIHHSFMFHPGISSENKLKEHIKQYVRQANFSGTYNIEYALRPSSDEILKTIDSILLLENVLPLLLVFNPNGFYELELKEAGLKQIKDINLKVLN